MKRPSSATFSRRSVSRRRALAAAATVALCGVLAEAQSAPRPSSDAPSGLVSSATDHLVVSAILAPLQITGGRALVLTANVTPKAGMHVYAPGSRYRAVTIKLAMGSPFRLEGPVEYPKPVLYTFKPLNESVPVYDTPFRLVARLGLDPAKLLTTRTQRPATLVVKALLDYQACDDRFCYLPESVPLRWTIASTR